ncbi:universal stress protein [Thiohalocapsa marina]|uniref:Universal stress protein n=1 Tax=Thiohalocapsa marina TaxID=424902 RepID=A0A5M8FI67_9GAMM|nr:universal stress protein [Thiohalocapsa marina]KAA6183660.1 universal stress protein [Thiohalocapsa marina]
MFAPKTPWSSAMADDMSSGHPPIIAAVSFDEQGRQCLRQACLRAVHAAQPVVALHVVHETSRTAGQYARYNQGAGLLPLTDIAKSMLAAVVDEVTGSDPACAAAEIRQLVIPGVPANRIPEVAELVQAELIILGGKDRYGLERLLAPGTPRSVLKRAGCKVLVIDETGQPQDAGKLEATGDAGAYSSA